MVTNNLDLARTLHDINHTKAISFESTGEYKKIIKLLGREKNAKRFSNFMKALITIGIFACAIFLLSLINQDLTILEILKKYIMLLPVAVIISGIGFLVVISGLCLLIYAILGIIKF